MKNPIQFGIIAGLVYLISILPELTIEAVSSEYGFDGNTQFLYATIHLLCLISAVIFYRAFILMADYYFNNTLWFGTVMTLVTIVIYHALKIFYDDTSEDVQKLMGLGYLLVIGGSTVVFGYGLMQIQGKLRSFAWKVGVVEIATGIFCLTIVLAFFALILTVPVILLEIALLRRFLPEYNGGIMAEPVQ
ncbi:MAG: hypothetical protein H6696_03855 [Deferribacteres bacterium]|nr:hypothetical protein [candidate division KSB1 bacterium]MCB9501047.1 hypothetical protein [Deferribacteres bacterium]